MAYSHKSRTTGTQEKEAVEKRTYDLIGIILQKREWWIGLVGKVEELSRHIQMCKDIGFSPSQMIIVERDKIIASALEKEFARFGRGRVFHGEFNKFLESHSFHYSFIDFDGTEGLNQSHLDLIDLFNYSSATVLRIVASGRTPTHISFKNLSKTLGMTCDYHQAKFMPADIRNAILDQSPEPLKQTIREDNARGNKAWLTIYKKDYPNDLFILEEYCKTKGLSCVYENYRNLDQPMRNIIISKNDKLERVAKITSGMDFRDINIGGNDIKVLLINNQFRTKFFLIEDEIYYGNKLVAIL